MGQLFLDHHMLKTHTNKKNSNCSLITLNIFEYKIKLKKKMCITTIILGTNITWSTPPLEQIKSNTFGSVETPSPVTNEGPYDNGIHISNPNTHG